MSSANVSFDTIPSSLLKPGKYFEFNTKLAVRSLPTNAQTVLVIGQRLAGGTVAALVPTQVFSGDQAALYFGAGSLAHRAAVAAMKANQYVALTVIAIDDAAAGVVATGTVTFTGTATADGAYALFIGLDRIDIAVDTGDTAATVGQDGKGVVTATADATGSDSNISTATAVQLMTPPAGVQTQATLLTMQGGLEVETYDQLRSRLLDRIQNPPGGGKVSDYKRWALEIPGITNAFVYPHRIAVGRVDVAVISGTGLPSQEEIEAVQTNIDLNRPAACRGVTVFAPELVTVEHVVQVQWSGSDLSDLHAALEPQFQAYYAALNPGESAVRTKLGSLVSDAAGVTDYVMLTPAENVAAESSNVRVQWVRYGSLSLQRMPS
ncbi:baseplate J/gp47 family protein [Burkholderia glumae]